MKIHKKFQKNHKIYQKFYQKPCYLENRVVREPCKQRTACTRYVIC